MNIDKFVLHKLAGGAKEDIDPLVRAYCFMIDKLGYRETMELPFPVFLEMLDYYYWDAEEQAKALRNK